MDDGQFAEVKENAELGLMAYMEQDDMQRAIRMAGEALEIIHSILADLVGTLPEEQHQEYAPDLTRIAEMLPFIR